MSPAAPFLMMASWLSAWGECCAVHHLVKGDEPSLSFWDSLTKTSG